MDLTERIQYLCESNGISLNALEKQLDFGTRTISKWKASSPKVENLIKIADYFNVSIDYLVGRKVFENNDFPISFEEFSAEFDKNKRLQQIAALPPEKQKIVFDTIDALLKNLEK